MQGNCLAKGNRLAVIAANCFVHTLEEKLFSILTSKPLLWIRYINDLIAVFDCNLIPQQFITTALKDLHPNISFTNNITTLSRRANFLDTYNSYDNNININLDYIKNILTLIGC